MGAAAARGRLRRADAAYRAGADPLARSAARPSLRPAGSALRGARCDRQEDARPLGRDHQPGLAAARAAESRVRRGDPEQERLEPVARAPSAGGALALALDRAAL